MIPPEYQEERRVFRTHFQKIVSTRTDMWCVIYSPVTRQIGATPVVAFGCRVTNGEYAEQSQWVPLVLHDYTLVAAESVPGQMGIIFIPGGSPPTQQQLTELLEED